MQFFSETEYKEKLEPKLRQIFTDNNAFDGVFAKEVLKRKIICDDEMDTDFVPPLSDAIIEAATKLGDKGFYLTAMFLEEPRHCYLSFSEFNLLLEDSNQENWDIFEDLTIWDYVVYSPSSQWGVMISRDDGKHGLIGGSKEFIEEIELSLPTLNFEQQIHNFLNYWSYYTDNNRYHTTWIFS